MLEGPGSGTAVSGGRPRAAQKKQAERLPKPVAFAISNPSFSRDNQEKERVEVKVESWTFNSLSWFCIAACRVVWI